MTVDCSTLLTSEVPASRGYASVSIIVPTKNRAEDLAEAVESILNQEVLPDELVIVDQSETDEGRKRVEQVFAGASAGVCERIALHYIHDTTITGSAQARNLGIERSTKEVIVLLDDDVILEPAFLKEMLDVYRDDATVDGVSAIITNYDKPGKLRRAYVWLFRRGPFRDERQRIYWNAERLRTAAPIIVRKFGAGGMSIRRDSMGPVRFDSQLKGVPGGEDVDFCCRLAGNCKLVIAPRSRYVHKRSPANRPEVHWLQRDVRSQYYLYFRNWRSSVVGRLCFAWLNIGFVLMAMIMGARTRSVEPLRALWRGIQIGRQDGRRV